MVHGVSAPIPYRGGRSPSVNPQDPPPPARLRPTANRVKEVEPTAVAAAAGSRMVNGCPPLVSVGAAAHHPKICKIHLHRHGFARQRTGLKEGGACRSGCCGRLPDGQRVSTPSSRRGGRSPSKNPQDPPPPALHHPQTDPLPAGGLAVTAHGHAPFHDAAQSARWTVHWSSGRAPMGWGPEPCPWKGAPPENEVAGQGHYRLGTAAPRVFDPKATVRPPAVQRALIRALGRAKGPGPPRNGWAGPLRALRPGAVSHHRLCCESATVTSTRWNSLSSL
jgi:hypothetical protein